MQLHAGKKPLLPIPGTDWRLAVAYDKSAALAGNNGIEISRDEKELYVAVSGTHDIHIYSLADTSKPLRSARAISSLGRNSPKRRL